MPAQRRADGPLPAPGDFVVAVRDRSVAALGVPGVAKSEAEALVRDCEVAVRLALSCVMAPPGEGGVARMVREVVRR